MNDAEYDSDDDYNPVQENDLKDDSESDRDSTDDAVQNGVLEDERAQSAESVKSIDLNEKVVKPRVDLEKQLLQEENALAKDTIRQLKQRLVRRTALVNDIRSYYLRDVVTIKHILEEVLNETEKEAVMKEYSQRLPSLDMTQHLNLHAPSNTNLRVTPCESCGGKVDAVLADSDEVVRLKENITIMKKREERLRLQVAELDAANDKRAIAKAELDFSHNEEVPFRYSIP